MRARRTLIPIEKRLALIGRRVFGWTCLGISHGRFMIFVHCDVLHTLTRKPENGRPFSRENAHSVRDAVARRLLTEKIFTTEITMICPKLVFRYSGVSISSHLSLPMLRLC